MEASTVAYAILDGIRSQTFTIAGSPFGVTASIGVALFPLHASAASELLSCADL
jgi:GGDEF domain-containing protein